ncbi:MAG TPA: hypothetical protein ENJ91_10665 [Rhodobacteraceae bacterium]|nr:hypothetical protein [Paracoccaceae bacterium]
MAKKKVNVASLLNEGGFAPSVIGSNEPVAPTRIVLDIDQIKEYEGNPRQEPNDRYHEIKASILADNIRNPLVVTKRPGEDHYIPAAGGNTRIRIVRELWQETREERFKKLEAIFRPWISEEWVLISHLTENVLRGEMLFIDLARCIDRIRKEQEDKTGRLSERQFVGFLSDQGFPISRRQCRRLLYAASLEKFIPQAIKTFGATHVDELVALEKNHRIEERRQLTADPFFEVLKKTDGPEFDLKRFKSVLDRTINQRLDKEGVSHSAKDQAESPNLKNSIPKKNQALDIFQLATVLKTPEYVEEGKPAPRRHDSPEYTAWWCLEALRCLDGGNPVPEPVPREVQFLMQLGQEPVLLEKFIARLRKGIRGEES